MSHNRLWKIAFIISFLINILYISSNFREDRIGVLKQDVKVQPWGETANSFILPKGLTVRDISLSGLGRVGSFEPYRYTIVITTQLSNLVEYKKSGSKTSGYHSIIEPPFLHKEKKIQDP